MSMEDRLKLANLMLLKLGDHTMRVKDWEKLCYREFRIEINFGHQKFWNLLPFLLKEGYVEKLQRGVYHVTEKGKKQLEVWKMEETK